MPRLFILVVALVLCTGCGSSRPVADIERGRQAVVAALDGWKANEPPEKLKTRSDPVEFAEELRDTRAD